MFASRCECSHPPHHPPGRPAVTPGRKPRAPGHRPAPPAPTLCRPAPPITRQELAERLALDYLDASGRHATYFAALPMLADARDTLSWESFPPPYLHLVQSPALVRIFLGGRWARAVAWLTAVGREW